MVKHERGWKVPKPQKLSVTYGSKTIDPFLSRSLVFSDLTRGLWDDRARLLEGLLHADEFGLGVVSRPRMRQLLRAHRLPINDDLMNCLLDV